MLVFFVIDVLKLGEIITLEKCDSVKISLKYIKIN